MDKTITEVALQEAILLLEKKQAEEGKLLKEEFHAAYEMLKPLNIVKNIFRETVTSPEIRDNVIDKTVDMALEFLTNKILKKTTISIEKRILGTALVLGIKNIISRNPRIVRKAGTGIMKIVGSMITKRNKNKEYAFSSHS